MNVPHDQIGPVLAEAIAGMARLQVRQEMMECVIRALIVESPPLYPLVWKALHTAKADIDQRLARSRPHTPPEMEAEALALRNELCTACAPPAR